MCVVAGVMFGKERLDVVVVGAAVVGWKVPWHRRGWMSLEVKRY